MYTLYIPTDIIGICTVCPEPQTIVTRATNKQV